MNLNLDRKTCKYVVLSILCIFVGINYWDTVMDLLENVLRASSPILVGLIIAYVLNILMTFYERHYFKTLKTKSFIQKSQRPVCLIAAVITLVSIISIIIWLVIPELISSVKLIVADIPPAIEKLLNNEHIKNMLPENVVQELYSINWKEHISNNAKALTKEISDAAGTVVSAVSSIGSGIITFVIGFIFAIYLLLSKEKLQNQCKRIMYSFLPNNINERIFHFADVLNESFHGYIVGQCTESIILGTLCIIGMLIFRFPYAVMIGTLIGFTALIPIAGAYIGAIIGAIIIFTVSPMKSLLFLIFLVILQQIEGNLIYPKVVGKSIGLPALIVLAAITVGGRLMGIGGMIIGVPIASALYTLLKEKVNTKEVPMKKKTV